MKPVITSDFIRGVLFSVLAYGLVGAANALHLGIISLQPIQLGGGLVLFGLHAVLCFALLVRSARSGKAVFIFFAMMAALQIGSAFYWKAVLTADTPSPLNVSFLISLLFSILFAVLSYGFYIRRFPEQVA